MRCLSWLSPIVLVFVRRANCFTVQNFSRKPLVQLFSCCNVRAIRGHSAFVSSGRGCTCPLRSSAHETALSLRGRKVRA